ncbi:C-C motif chemokine 22-like [Seriola aureovittata]|uniref:C-C motif chemokine 22-like n=1 Tax=Seriola aureovittata TaxID=2871759 RepID=UPI0024BE97C7|nr:C-C motif chemokine 22-like [Seriola aureovittata]
MKTLLTLLFLTLICSLHHTSAGPVAVEMMVKGACCPGYNQTRIPKARVKHVAMTPDGCTDKAVVVTTVCDKKICIDPNWPWAKKLLSAFEKSAGNTASPAAPSSKC